MKGTEAFIPLSQWCIFPLFSQNFKIPLFSQNLRSFGLIRVFSFLHFDHDAFRDNVLHVGETGAIRYSFHFL